MISLLSISSTHGLPRRSIDFLFEFPWSDIGVDLFMGVTLVMLVDGSRVEWVLKWNKSLIGINKSGENWCDLLNTGLEMIVYHQYQVDPCVFYRKDSVILTYVNYFVIVSCI